jgi:hypothetical protein
MSIIRADNVAPSAGGTVKSLVRGVASAWANLDGTGTIALRDSLNVSSVVDNGTGDYTKNFTNAMANANYSTVFGVSANTLTNFARTINLSGAAPSTTDIRVRTANTTFAVEDLLYVNAQIHGDLA